MSKVVILSGAGISAESGISTFRAKDGLWNNHKIEDICTAGCLKYNRENTIAFYDALRVSLENKKPNKAHIKISILANKFPDKISVITQNVDDLFEKANCKNIIHLHGFLPEVCCEKCSHKFNIGYAKQNDSSYDQCTKCGHDQIRPNIVFFGESAPMYKILYKELENCEMLVVVGTSGAVINTDMFLNSKIKISILNNLEPSIHINDELYSKSIFKPATEAVDEIVDEVLGFLKI